MCKTMVRCSVCGEMFAKDECVKVISPKTHYEYICEEHHEMMLGYGSEVGSENLYEMMMKLKGVMEENGFKKSVAKVVSITTGFEFEVGYGVDEELARILMTYGYVRTSDCTVQAEYKSPIYRNLNGIAKLLYSVVENGMGSIGTSAGTHVNVWSENLNTLDYDRIRYFYDELFYELYEFVNEDDEHSTLFGRDIDDTDDDGRKWAKGFGNDVHASFINTERCKRNHPRVEFRLCKYDNNKQFMTCLKFCNECMKTIMINFCNNYKENDMTHNLHKARVTSKKLVRVYKKYRGL